ncbi:MAG TPA: acetyl-CoA carboxylase biotin carboxylase subunit [Polyangiaceae bacterium LLY-WYZ-15_(1-7)]|nr:3-methylcrotonyl-CoA carboxylase [Sandaracinus sp.]HJL03902.1 acetyl-CoA carboxylase biotin carboxylase subunit [Polyangiaceae bacterium LLY-WYZ-15_(1-7)]HJL07638.1 acetyl-CoA carboxylase biotin carboxylase subunit [Polyangiaceae bacterium LLY-WYZ-15_(1-7)]
MTQPIHKVLIANRGEIARRIMRTCRAMGVETVAVYSDADAAMPFVREADEAVRLGPAPSRESYLVVERILEAAERTGADAIHPGYGFLAENADFAQAVADAGRVFIGPTPDAIRAMGSKKEAKALVAKAGVPVVPGYDGADQDPAVLAAKAKEIGFPVLLKASAGGGGKGMKRVDEAGQLEAAIESAKREAMSSFGDDVLLVEKYVERPRHVEIQIFGDAHGNVVHLFERECSIQRRHQKVLEESPSPALDEALRAKMGEAAVEAGKAIGYRNAGTVEFILGQDGSFYFLEVNTRLQVEHPVTEGVTGLDLVREQLRVAEGHPLSFTQGSLEMRGAALEARVYAEDPAGGFLPQSGPVIDWHLPELEGVRVDAGVESGSEVGIHYDPMLAKIITVGADRVEATRRMRRALRALSVQGLTTNRAFLLKVLEHPAYLEGAIHTHFIEEHAEALETGLSPQAIAHAAVAATLAEHERRRAGEPHLPHVPTGFRNNPRSWEWVEYQHADASGGDTALLRLEYRHDGRRPGHFTMRVGHAEHAVELLAWDAPTLRLAVDGLRFDARVITAGAKHFVHARGESVALEERPRFPDRSLEVPAGGCIAPMPGAVVKVNVAEGDAVEAGQVLMVMEAMKMEHAVTAPHAGKVAELHVGEGDQVDADALLAVVEEA